MKIQISGKTLLYITASLAVLSLGYYAWVNYRKENASYEEEDLFIEEDENEAVKKEDQQSPVVEEKKVEEKEKVVVNDSEKRAEEIEDIVLTVASTVADEGFASLDVHTKEKDPETEAKRSFVRLEAVEYEGGQGDPGGIQILLDFRIPKAAYPRLRDRTIRSTNSIPTEHEFLKTLLGSRSREESYGELSWDKYFQELLLKYVDDSMKLYYHPVCRWPKKVLLLEVYYEEQYILRPGDEGFKEDEEITNWITVSRTIECPEEFWRNNPFCDRRFSDKDLNPFSDKGLYFSIMRILEKDRNREGIPVDDSLLKPRSEPNCGVRNLRIVGAYFSVRFSYFWQRHEKNATGINMDQLLELLRTIYTNDTFVVRVPGTSFLFRWKKLALIDIFQNWDSHSCKECAFEQPKNGDDPNTISSSEYF